MAEASLTRVLECWRVSIDWDCLRFPPLCRGRLPQLVGPSGVGKTQLCMTAVAEALVDPHHMVVYIDTERKFSAERYGASKRTNGGTTPAPTPTPSVGCHPSVQAHGDHRPAPAPDPGGR